VTTNRVSHHVVHSWLTMQKSSHTQEETEGANWQHQEWMIQGIQ
jgi:hypothetical protein